MKVFISQEDFYLEVKQIASTTELSRGRARELIVGALGFDGVNYMRKVAPNHTSYTVRNEGEGVDLEQMNFMELECLSDQICLALNSYLPSRDRVDTIGFVEKEIRRKTQQYKRWDNAYPLVSYLLILPYITGDYKHRPETVAAQEISDWHVDICVKSIVERYYRRFKLDAIGAPFYGDEEACRKSWVEEFMLAVSEDRKTSSFWEGRIDKLSSPGVNSGERFLYRGVINDILSGGDGAFLFESIKKRVHEEEARYPFKNVQSNVWHLISHMPQLAKEEYGRDCFCETSFLCCSLSDQVTVDSLSSDSFPEVSFRYPLVLSEHEGVDLVRLTREDLSSGLIIRSHNGKCESVVTTLQAQLLSQGHGLLCVSSDTTAFNTLSDLGKIATRLGRQEMMLAIGIGNVEQITPFQLASALVGGAIVVVDAQELGEKYQQVFVDKLKSAFLHLKSLHVPLDNLSVNSCLFTDHRGSSDNDLSFSKKVEALFFNERLWRVTVNDSQANSLSCMYGESSSNQFAYSLDLSVVDGVEEASLAYRKQVISDRDFKVRVVNTPRCEQPHYLPLVGHW